MGIQRKLTDNDIGLPVIINLVNPSKESPKMYGKIIRFTDTKVFVDCDNFGKTKGYDYQVVTIDIYSAEYPVGGQDKPSVAELTLNSQQNMVRNSRRLDAMFGETTTQKHSTNSNRRKKL